MTKPDRTHNFKITKLIRKINFINFISLIILLLLVASCIPNTKEEAFEKYKKLLEDKKWCEITSNNKLFFEEGKCMKFLNDSVINLGKYKLSITPSHNLTNKWYMPIRTIEINTKSGNNYLFELSVGSSKKLLVFENYRDKTMLFFSDDCILNDSDSVSYRSALKYNYKIINLK